MTLSETQLGGDGEHAITEVAGVLLVTLRSDLDITQINGLHDAVLARLQQRQQTALVLDCSGVDVLGSSELDNLGKLLAEAGLMGTQGAICSLAPGIASYIVQQDLKLPKIPFFLTLEDALNYFESH